MTVKDLAVKDQVVVTVKPASDCFALKTGF